jgi:hypothetical protein
VTVSTFKDITANSDVYENRHYLWDTLSISVSDAGFHAGKPINSSHKCKTMTLATIKTVSQHEQNVNLRKYTWHH